MALWNRVTLSISKANHKTDLYNKELWNRVTLSISKAIARKRSINIKLWNRVTLSISKAKPDIPDTHLCFGIVLL